MQIALWVFGFLHLFIDVYLCENIGGEGGGWVLQI